MAAEPRDLIQAPGTAEDRWRAWPALSGPDRMDLSTVTSAVVLAAQPGPVVAGDALVRPAQIRPDRLRAAQGPRPQRLRTRLRRGRTRGAERRRRPGAGLRA